MNGIHADLKRIAKNLPRLQEYIQEENRAKVEEFVRDLHPADLAEIMDELSNEERLFFFEVLPQTVRAETLMELDEDEILFYIKDYAPSELVEKIVKNLNTDDAVDLIQLLGGKLRIEVLRLIEQLDKSEDIIELLRYKDDTAGALMEKEMMVVHQDWTAFRCLKEIRSVSEEVPKIHNIYVVDEKEKLVGLLPVKSLLVSSTRSRVDELYQKEIVMVNVEEDAKEVAYLMQKYNLVVLPVIDHAGRLVGRITIDDVVDYITEEAEKDYQLASGIANDVEIDDSIFKLSKARLPWLIIGMVGGLASAKVMGLYELFIEHLPIVAFFVPLITATGGNVGVQSSAIMVRALADSGNLNQKFSRRVVKEFVQSLSNSILLALFVFGATAVLGFEFKLSLAVSCSLSIVIVMSSLLGTLVPLFLDRNKIDPALATGPFITTLNDIMGIVVYFYWCSQFLEH